MALKRSSRSGGADLGEAAGSLCATQRSRGTVQKGVVGDVGLAPGCVGRVGGREELLGRVSDDSFSAC